MQTSLHLVAPSDELQRVGFRFGDKGTQTSRTIMLSELTELLAAVPPGAERGDYTNAIVGDNALGKATAATRKLTDQRLRELYGLDPAVPLFRVLRHLWLLDEEGRPLIAMLCALARDPLLRQTAQHVLSLPAGAELVRSAFLDTLREITGRRLNEAVLDKVARNAASSWSQSGHLDGRVRKVRRLVTATPGSVAMALWMGALEGLAGEGLLQSRWTQVLDLIGEGLVPVVLVAKQLGLVQARVGGGVVEIDTRRLEAVAKGG